MSLAAHTYEIDLPALAARFGRRLGDAGVPVTPDRAARLADALALVRPIARRRLYWTARAVLLSDQSHAKVFDAVFAEVFGSEPRLAQVADQDAAEHEPAPPDAREPEDGGRAADTRAAGGSAAAAATLPRAGRGDRELPDMPVPVAASDEERLRTKRFDTLEAAELAAIQRLMTQMRIATPQRRTRRSQHDRLGERIDLRRTLRASRRSGGDPLKLERRRRREVPRRIVVLCDISGSMEPYARAYLHFLTSAAGSGAHAEAFVFATRLTRVTRALKSRSPERAIQRAAAAAPDWSSGTRIGDALRQFNDRHGRRGMARGAVVVILSDGWERGEPALVGREMERLARLAYRIVWVNPRAAAKGFTPSAGGMAAALPHVDALVSGETLEALREVVAAIAAERGEPSWVPAAVSADEEEPWASATPVPGSSVAMPSGYGPSRGNTTPGWSR
jgi:uncharacterized protein with von Willebrand factor type A (vWA) domain